MGPELATQTNSFLRYLVIVNLVLWLIFSLVRIPFMNSENFMTMSGEAPTWLDAFYTSLMVQTTIGNASVLPKSKIAKAVTGVQGLCLFLMLVAVCGCCFFGKCSKQS